MKYMGSKRSMLTNGLGALLSQEIPKHRRFIDLFSGSGAVAWHAARQFSVETLAYDLQLYGSVLAAGILDRTCTFDGRSCWSSWKRRAQRKLNSMDPPEHTAHSAKAVLRARLWSSTANGSLVRAYGGHYYSPKQACWIEALRSTLPEQAEERAACLAALVMACSKCAASPGHTAQPFQPTPTAISFLAKSWERNILDDVASALYELSRSHAKVRGFAAVGEANSIAATLVDNDLVFVDPPYSAVQYSRFYHVLEAVAHGEAPDVFGAGRYPRREERASSAYSFKSQSLTALTDLLKKLADNGTTVILTFPDHECSNGISGDSVRKIASENFRIIESSVSSIFSTLGGPAASGSDTRTARRHANELILLLRQR